MLQLVTDTSLDAAVVMRTDGTIVAWNKVAEATFGWTASQALGRRVADLIIPPELREAHSAALERYRHTGQGRMLNQRIEVTALRASGEIIPVELSITPATDESGEEVFLGFLRDISARKQHEAALRETAQRLKATYEHAFVSIAETDRDGRFLRMNAQLSRISGYSEAELRNLTLFDLTHPEDVPAERQQYERQWRGEIDTYSIEKRYITKAGALLWIEVLASLVKDDDGRPLYGIRVVRDITERKQSEIRQQLLINELNHRVKNSLAIVQSIAHQTFAPDTEQFRAFSGRLRAIAAAHDLLTEGLWEWVSLEDLIRRVLQPYSTEHDSRISIGGPFVEVPPKLAVTLSVALYELGTNAAKYGALTAAEGRVTIGWSVAPVEAGAELRLQWQESGGPPVKPPKASGFGTRLLERGLAAELQGEVRLDFRSEGLVCLVRAPAPAREQEA